MFLAACLGAANVTDFSPGAILAGAPRTGEYFYRLLPHLELRHLFDGVHVKGSLAYWFFRLNIWLRLLLDTIQMAWLATMGAALAAALISFFAARNLAPYRWLSPVGRRFMEAVRTVPDLVYALILVWAYGIGPLAGVLAMFLHSTGSLGKLFTELNEQADMAPLDGLTAVGATWTQRVRFGIVPQILPGFVSYTLLRLEVNIRGAAVLGLVGAGGIGQELYAAVSQNYYSDVSAILVLILATVMIIDRASEALRHRLIGLASP